MSVLVVKRRVVDDAFRTFLDAQCDFPIGLVDIPDEGTDDPPEKYALLQPIDGGESYGPPLVAPEQDQSLQYQVTCVGLDARQAQWVADEVRRAVCDRTITFTVAEHGLMGRGQVGGAGAVHKEEGVYQSVDTYELKVSRTS